MGAGHRSGQLAVLHHVTDNRARAFFETAAAVRRVENDYGYLRIQTQLLSTPEMLLGVPAAAFHPPPKVESAVVRLLPRAEFRVPDVGGFLRFAGMCFRQKRKTLRNNLLAVYGKELVDELPEGRKRAEQLTIENLAALYARLSDVAR